MKLTQVLLKYHPMWIGHQPKFRGDVLRGKHKFVPPVTRGTRYLLWLKMRNEEEVLKYLDKPYITAEEEERYLASKGRRHQEFADDYLRQTIEKPMKQAYGIDVLERLEANRQFEILS